MFCGRRGSSRYRVFCFFFFNDPATTEIYTLSLHDALPIYARAVTGQLLCADQEMSLSQLIRPTMRDVAALAGVSLKTGSPVFNGGTTVDPVLASQVQRAAAQLNYQPNLTASSLRRGDRKSLMIGLMLEDAANPYSASIYRSAEDVARTRGVGVLAGSIDEDAERERELAAALFLRRVDGPLTLPARRG